MEYSYHYWRDIPARDRIDGNFETPDLKFAEYTNKIGSFMDSDDEITVNPKIADKIIAVGADNYTASTADHKLKQLFKYDNERKIMTKGRQVTYVTKMPRRSSGEPAHKLVDVANTNIKKLANGNSPAPLYKDDYAVAKAIDELDDSTPEAIPKHDWIEKSDSDNETVGANETDDFHSHESVEYEYSESDSDSDSDSDAGPTQTSVEHISAYDTDGETDDTDIKVAVSVGIDTIGADMHEDTHDDTHEDTTGSAEKYFNIDPDAADAMGSAKRDDTGGTQDNIDNPYADLDPVTGSRDHGDDQSDHFDISMLVI